MDDVNYFGIFILATAMFVVGLWTGILLGRDVLR